MAAGYDMLRAKSVQKAKSVRYFPLRRSFDQRCPLALKIQPQNSNRLMID